jgi:hypothetical protein
MEAAHGVVASGVAQLNQPHDRLRRLSHCRRIKIALGLAGSLGRNLGALSAAI